MAATITPLLRAVPDAADTKQRIASSIDALADISGYGQAQLAALTGIDATALSKIIHGRRGVSGAEIETLAVVFDVPAQTLYIGGDEIRRRARLGVLSDPTGPNVPPGLGVSDRACNGENIDFGTRASRPLAVAA